MSEDQVRRYEDVNPDQQLSEAIADLLARHAKLQQDVEALKDEKLAAEVKIASLKRERDEQNYLVEHDGMTGLWSKTGFSRVVGDYANAINKLESEGSDFSDFCGVVVVIDLTRFKRINDTYGHDIGDEFIKAAGERLKVVFRTDPDKPGLKDVVGRMGGDEFYALIPKFKIHGEDSYTIDQLNESLTKRLGAIDVTFNHNGQETRETLGASVGLVPFELKGLSREDVATAIKQADQYMYEHKAEQHATEG